MKRKPAREVLDQMLGPRPFVLRAGPARPASQQAATAERCAVLLGRMVDPEFDEVERLLRYLRVPVVRCAAESAGACLGSVSPDGGFVAFGRARKPTVCWSRAEPASVARDAREVLRQESARTLAAQITALAPLAVPGARLGLIEQLAGASRAGARVPRTVVTSDPGRAVAGLAGRDFMVKVLGSHFIRTSPGLFHGALPQVLTRAQVTSLVSSGVPVVLQEHIPHTAEYRVYYVGGRVSAFAVTKPSPAAPWTSPGDVLVRELPVPPDASRLVRSLARRWNLRFGAFALLRATEGLVFLEVNEDGDWRWFEGKASVRCVSMAAALLVKQLHAAAGGTTAGPGGHGLDLMSFLIA
jgi:hypothetical protein